MSLRTAVFIFGPMQSVQSIQSPYWRKNHSRCEIAEVLFYILIALYLCNTMPPTTVPPKPDTAPLATQAPIGSWAKTGPVQAYLAGNASRPAAKRFLGDSKALIMAPTRWPASIESEIRKRMTMNLMIQGAACQAWLTGHHFVRDELDEIEPRAHSKLTNTQFYDQLGPAALLSQWNSTMAMTNGSPMLFWNQVGSGRTLFCGHPLLARYGKELARKSKRTIVQRCQEKQVRSMPFFRTIHLMNLMMRARRFESGHEDALANMAADVTSEIWGIDRQLLKATITDQPEFGNIRTARTAKGKRLREIMVGWSGVEQDSNGTLRVVARSKYWSVLIHELTKGAVELIGLHGLHGLDEETYSIVMLEADQIEFEVWMLQSGLELYRRLLMTIPLDATIAESLMQVASMPAELHEEFFFAVVTDTSRAAAIFRAFAAS